MLLAFHAACTALFIGVLICMGLYLCFTKRTQAMLCTECQQCKPSCPQLTSGCDPVAIMKATKSGSDIRGERCTLCRACEKRCDRGLAPYREVMKRRKRSPGQA